MEAIWIAFAFVFGLAFRHIGLPPLIGYLAAGFLLTAFDLEGGPSLEHLAHLGVLLLLFSVGLKLRLKYVLRPEVWGGAILHFVITSLPLGLAIYWLSNLGWTMAFLVAITLGFSSTVVAAKVLEEKGELRAFHGRVAIGILIIQDLVAVALLSVVGGHAPSPLIFILLGLPLLRPLIYRLLDFSGHDELIILYGLLLALVIGGLGFEHLGLSSELGALVFGAMLANHPKAGELSDALWGLKEIFLVGFFLQIGMSGLPTLEALGFALILALLLPIKAALFFFILLRFKLRARSSFLTGLSLASYSEFALIVAQLAVHNGLFDADWLVMLAITVVVSFVIAAPLNRLAHDLYERLETRLIPFEMKEHHPDEQPISLGMSHILIMGMDRVGTAAYDFLTHRQERVAGLDSDPNKVEQHLKEGRRVLYADAEDPGFWQNVNLSGIKAVMLTMPDLEAKRIAATQLRRRGYRGLISATSHYPEEGEILVALGVDMTFNYADEAGVGFAEHIWEALYPAKDTPAPAHG